MAENDYKRGLKINAQHALVDHLKTRGIDSKTIYSSVHFTWYEDDMTLQVRAYFHLHGTVSLIAHRTDWPEDSVSWQYLLSVQKANRHIPFGSFFYYDFSDNRTYCKCITSLDDQLVEGPVIDEMLSEIAQSYRFLATIRKDLLQDSMKEADRMRTFYAYDWNHKRRSWHPEAMEQAHKAVLDKDEWAYEPTMEKDDKIIAYKLDHDGIDFDVRIHYHRYDPIMIVEMSLDDLPYKDEEERILLVNLLNEMTSVGHFRMPRIKKNLTFHCAFKCPDRIPERNWFIGAMKTAHAAYSYYHSKLLLYKMGYLTLEELDRRLRMA